jgi:hypothetical protein
MALPVAPRHIDAEPDGVEVRRDYGPEMSPAWWHWQSLREVILVNPNPVTGRPEPVATQSVLANLVGAAVSAVVVALAALGYLDWTPEVQGLVVAAIMAVFNVASAIFLMRPRVTPVSDPRGRNGDPLYDYDDALNAVRNGGPRG